MSKLLVAIGAVVAFAAGWGIGFALRVPDVQVTVSVDSPKEGVDVSVDGKLRGTTDAEGKLKFDVRARINSQVSLVLSKENYEPVERVLAVPPDLQLWVGDVQLSVVEIEVTLTLIAVDDMGGPLSSVAVTVNGVPQALATDASGRWEAPVTAPYGASISVAVSGVPGQQTFAATSDRVLTFERPAGVPVLITATNKVSGVAVLAGGQVVGRTDSEGKAALSLPADTRQLSFKLAGAEIEAWYIPADRMGAAQQIEHEIKVMPAADLRLNITTHMEDSPQQGAPGFGVVVAGVRGVTDENGSANVLIPKARILIGERLRVEVSRGKDGIGSRSFVVEAGQQSYSVDVTVSVPKFVRFRVSDEEGRPIPRVLVKVDGRGFGETDGRGMVEGGVQRLNVEYRFTFHKKGYYSEGPLAISPGSPLTERQVTLKSLTFVASFVDSITGRPVEDLEVWYGGVRLFTTQGVAERVSIAGLGEHVFELRSADEQYPKSQVQRVVVQTAGEKKQIRVVPNPVSFRLQFIMVGERERPARDREVRISGGYAYKGRTDEGGWVEFGSHGITLGQSYTATLILPTWEYSKEVKAVGYRNERRLKVPLCAHVIITTKAGQQNSELKLYADNKSYVLGKSPLESGHGSLEIDCLQFADYYLVAVGEAEVKLSITVDRQDMQIPVDTSDPFARAEGLREEGKMQEAIPFYELVTSRHRRYSDAQKRLGFYYNAKGEFNLAYEHFKNAIEDSRHKVDPYLYLGGSQASHRAGDYPTCIIYAQKAFTYWQMFAKGEKGERRDDARYLEALCYHDDHFKGEHENRSCDDTQSSLKKVRYKWETFADDAGADARDAADRIDQVDGEFLNLSCQ